MIFQIHYFAFNAGLSGVLLIITVFLRKYTDASSTEVGTLLMALPFVAVFTKPFFCALADRHRRYRLYFILSIVFALLGFGSYTLLPFFPDFIASNGRLAWYLMTAATVLGYIAYGVTWSLGDAYAANVAHRTNSSFGSIRLWGTIGWGVAGAFVGVISPYCQLPEMVLGLIIFVITFVFEILFLWWWPHEADFIMGDALPSHGADDQPPEQTKSTCRLATIDEKQPAEVQQLEQQDAQGTKLVLSLSQIHSGQLSIERDTHNNTTLAISTKICIEPNQKLDFLANTTGNELTADEEAERRRISDMQMTIFKLLVKKHRSLVKYLVIFTILGAIFNIHFSYFFLHLDRLAMEGGSGDFATLASMCLVAQAVGETFCFAIAPQVVRKLGRDGSITLNLVAYLFRYYGNGVGIPQISPYVAIFTESLQGINYGIFYFLITDTALHYALQVDDILPDLRRLGLVTERTNVDAVRTSLRATMQGIFSGAFDGLGFGLGSLFAGLYLEAHSYEQLWCCAGAGAAVVLVLHAAYELLMRKLRAPESSLVASKEVAPADSTFVCCQSMERISSN